MSNTQFSVFPSITNKRVKKEERSEFNHANAGVILSDTPRIHRRRFWDKLLRVWSSKFNTSAILPNFQHPHQQRMQRWLLWEN